MSEGINNSNQKICDMTPKELSNYLDGKISLSWGSIFVLVIISLIPLLMIIIPVLILSFTISDTVNGIKKEINNMNNDIKSEIVKVNHEIADIKDIISKLR